MSLEIKSFLRYPGAKWLKAPWIVNYFPAHTIYIEPYMGSAACFFAKEPANHEVLNDLSESVVNLFKVIREQSTDLCALLEMTPWSRAEYDASFEQTGNSPEDARRFLVRCWQAHGTRLNGKTGWKHRGPSAGGSTAGLWKKLPARLLAVTDRLRDAEIENKPALQVIAKYNTPDTLLYVDPPYVLSTRHGPMYEHEMNNQDHRELLALLVEHPGMIILSGYAHPLYEEYLSDWHQVRTASLSEHGKTNEEILWINPLAAGIRQQSFL